MEYAGTDNTFAMADHDDHIHVGFQPDGGDAVSMLRPDQWDRLVSGLGRIRNPVVPIRPSRWSIAVTKRAAEGRRQAAADGRDQARAEGRRAGPPARRRRPPARGLTGRRERPGAVRLRPGRGPVGPRARLTAATSSAATPASPSTCS